jgi:hypothetical protein
MLEMYGMVLAEASGKRSMCDKGNATSTSSTEGQKKQFMSSNLALGVYAKSIERIWPLGERDYKNKK